MKLNIFLVLTLTATFFAASCGSSSTNTTANVNVNKAGADTMDHSKMDHASVNSNSLGNMDHSMMDSSPNAAAAPYDLQFLDTMIHHHQRAVDMAGPAEEKADHAEIKTLSKNIISSQKQEIAQMKEWREKWFPGAAPAVNMEMAGMADSMKGMDMAKLNGLSGNAFDLEFISQMTPHHQGAVVMAKEALDKSTKPEIKSLAHAIIKAQEGEIERMKEWHSIWSRRN